MSFDLTDVPISDSHCHLQYFDDVKDVLRRAFEHGIRRIICPAVTEGDFERCLEISEKSGEVEVKVAVGVHPLYPSEVSFDALLRFASDPRVVAIGETGIDLFKSDDEKRQRELLRLHFEVAWRTAKPLVIHTRGEKNGRSAFDVVIEMIEEFEREGKRVRGVFHCFSWGKREALIAKEKGFFISWAGNLTYSSRLQKTLRETPLDWSLVETDAPFLTPSAEGKKRNEPLYIIWTLRKIAKLKGISFEDAVRTTTTNLWRLFKMGPDPEPRITYKIRNSLYINLTIRCTLACVFCGKHESFFVRGHNLRIKHEPTVEEVLREVGDPTQYDEIVFCGYGEPTLRIEELKAIARELKKLGAKKIRINTDGLANLVHRRNILPELAGIVDSISVSLNAPDEETYAKVCPSRFGKEAYRWVKNFIREAKKYIPEVIATAVTYPGVDIQRTREVAEKELGVKFRARIFGEIG